MKLLVPLPFDVSNLAHGRNLRVVHLLRGLNARTELTCLTSDAHRAGRIRSVLPDVRVEAAERLPLTNQDQVLPRGPAWVRSALTFFGCDAPLLAALLDRVEQADIVVGFDMPSVAYLHAAASAGVPVVADLIDDPLLLRRSFPLRYRLSPGGVKAALGIYALRRSVLPRLDGLIAVASRDARSLGRGTGARTYVVPNGVAVSCPSGDGTEREPLVVFTGAMDFPPNIAAATHFVRHVWPSVRRLGGDRIRFAIVGANPVDKVRRLSEAPGVEVTGRVPDVMDWLQRALVAVAPMISGCGIKNKILEACAAGCPVVTTPLGAAGLPTGSDVGILAASTSREMAERLASLVQSPEDARAMGESARLMVRDRFSWSAAVNAFVDVLEVCRSHAAVDRCVGRDVRRAARRAFRSSASQDREALAHAAS